MNDEFNFIVYDLGFYPDIRMPEDVVAVFANLNHACDYVRFALSHCNLHLAVYNRDTKECLYSCTDNGALQVK